MIQYAWLYLEEAKKLLHYIRVKAEKIREGINFGVCIKFGCILLVLGFLTVHFYGGSTRKTP